jgi:hypothetical protein
MEGVFAVASCGRVMVGRVSDKGYEDLWSYQTEGVSFLSTSYGYHLVDLAVADN